MAKFVNDKEYLTKSKARKIRHVTNWSENLEYSLTKFALTVKKITFLLFKFFGLGHLGEDQTAKIAWVIVLIPFAALILALIYDHITGAN